MRAEVNPAPDTPDPGSSGWQRHWPVGVVLAAAAFLLFAGLGRDYLWADEGDTAILAESILKFGVPTAWDGVTLIDSDYGARLNDDFVMVSHPWLQYYLTAASFALFGESTLAARVPFAVLGLLTIVLVYATVLRVTQHRWTAASAAVLLTLSVQFLLYSRQSRNYSLSAALTCLLVFQFLRMNSWRGAFGFATIAILLFHSHPIAVAPLAALGVLTLAYRPFQVQRRWFWIAMTMVVPFTLPWLFMAERGYREQTGVIASAGQLLPRLAQYAVEVASVTSVVGAIVIGAVLLRRRARLPQPAARRGKPVRRHVVAIFTDDERRLLAIVAAIVASFAVAMAVTQPRDVIWSVGLRYTSAVLPLMAMTLALLTARVSSGNPRVWVALLLVLGFTKFGRLTPWTFWERPAALRDPAAIVAFHNPDHWVDRLLRTEQIAFVSSLFERNVGTSGQVIEFLKTHAKPADIVVTNYGWESLYFHTNLPQGLTVLPTYPIYRAARDQGLPDYVFSADRARWIVWRQAWGAYRGQAIDRVLAQLKEGKIPVFQVATFPETLWENRENVHYRRFPGRRYIYPWYENVPSTVVYRVDWEKTPLGGE